MSFRTGMPSQGWRISWFLVRRFLRKGRRAARSLTGWAWLGGASFVHRRLLCDRRLPLAARYKVFKSVLTSTCMCGLETVRLTQKQRNTLSVNHSTFASLMHGLSRKKFNTWVEWYAARRRKTRGWLNRHMERSWGREQVHRQSCGTHVRGQIDSEHLQDQGPLVVEVSPEHAPARGSPQRQSSQARGKA